MKSRLTVAIIGRANVGKSTLFNRLTDQSTALISPVAGTTRDRLEATCAWQGMEFTVIDSGGFDIDKRDEIDQKVLEQTDRAIENAKLILFVVDTNTGILPADKNFIAQLKKKKKKILLVANKADTLKKRQLINEFYQLGLGEPLPVSASNGSGTGDLLDKIVSMLNLNSVAAPWSPKEKKPISLIFIGQPNVGKSSLINAILNEERIIVSPIPHTTRGVQVIDFNYRQENFRLLDTAGLRRRRDKSDLMEKFSYDQIRKVLPLASVAILVIDVTQNLTVQDKKIASWIVENNVNIVIAVNKWDLIPNKDDKTINQYIKNIYQQLPAINYAPIIFTSAAAKQRVQKILDLAKETYQERFKKLTPETCAEFLSWAIKKNPPQKDKGMVHPKLLGFEQVSVNPPRFVLKKDGKSSLAMAYVKYLNRQLREKFGFLGTPLIIAIETVDLRHRSKR